MSAVYTTGEQLVSVQEMIDAIESLFLPHGCGR